MSIEAVVYEYPKDEPEDKDYIFIFKKKEAYFFSKFRQYKKGNGELVDGDRFVYADEIEDGVRAETTKEEE